MAPYCTFAVMDDKKRFDRILEIYFLLQSRAVVSAQELTDRLGVSQRTIYRDLRALNDAGVPVVNDAEGGYSLLDGFRLQPSAFSREEMQSILIAEKMMQKHETLSVRQQFENVAVKIRSSFRFSQKAEFSELQNKLNYHAGSDSQSYLPGIIDTLLNSIVTEEVLAVSYIKAEEVDAEQREIEPVGVYYENKFWYTLAYCRLRGDYRNFRLDRVKHIRETGKKFSSSHPSLDELRTVDNKLPLWDVKIKLSIRYAHYLSWDRDNFGFTQEYIQDKMVYMLFKCRHCPKAFARWLLGYADVVEIIEPELVRDELKRLLASASAFQDTRG